SLVRLHSEKIKPPRALWVPFELGRPLGVPNDADFQHKVIDAAFDLLSRKQGPVLEDYPEDVPGGTPTEEEFEMAGQVCPIDLPPPPTDDSDLMQALEAEIGRLAPWYEMAVNQRGRTTVGISEIDILDAARYLVDMAEAEAPDVPRDDLDRGPMLKLCCEDLKAFYSEAMSAQPGMDTSLAIENWLWSQTSLGKAMWQLREVGLESDDEFIRYHAQRSLIPDRQIHLREENPRVFDSFSLVGK
ncbi:MAG TPA: hypothetical protein DCE33_15950, partial [Rhodospirillaceae bacterium]|nr:hypothetical protein [Rhodospirillaceae bacterium]